MMSTLRLLRFILMVISGVCGTFFNCSIVGLNFRFWRDITISGSYKKILFVIGLVNIFMQGILIFEGIFDTLPFGRDQTRLLLIMTLEFALFGVSIWSTTWLSMFCCLRLLNSSHWLFLKIRVKFFSWLSYLIVASALVSLAINLPIFWTTTLDNPYNTSEFTNMSGQRITVDYYYMIFSLVFSFSFPFSMTCVSIGLSVSTLLRHIWRISNSDSHLTSAQLQGHHQAVRTMVIRVVVDFLFFLIIVIGIANSSILNSLAYSLLWMIIVTYPTSQAFILIFGNPKLRSGVWGVLKALGK
ncbi:hypothetical protein GDO81_027795 [Engystomops pustulosus]|uniref:Taste receptor type 2 n=1 Tax=Engystomops pustulosus TaxID=76066 RepID=A0AAV6ZQ14_ENGPU|nr:hypothetical protein GDO81_027795 [Engystomops pustulosus]